MLAGIAKKLPDSAPPVIKELKADILYCAARSKDVVHRLNQFEAFFSEGRLKDAEYIIRYAQKNMNELALEILEIQKRINSYWDSTSAA